MEAVLITCLQFGQLVSRVNNSYYPAIVKQQIIAELVRVSPKKCSIDANG